jgi:hypothetical protein
MKFILATVLSRNKHTTKLVTWIFIFLVFNMSKSIKCFTITVGKVLGIVEKP